MAKYLKQSTAAHIMFGPFVDKTDGVTLEVAAGIVTSIDHATTGIFLSKNGAAGAIRHQNVTASVLDAYGMFQVHLDTTDTDTVGNLRVMMAEAATFLPVWDDYVVLPANVYDSLMGTDTLDVSVTAMATDSVTAAAVKADAVTKIQNGLATPTNITAGTIATVTNLTNLPAITANWLTAAGIDTTAVTELQAGLALEATLTAIKGVGWTTETLKAIDVLIDAIKLKTDALDVSSVTVVAAVSGSTITILRGDTFDDAHLLNLGNLTDYVSLDFIVKRSTSELDDEATIHIRKNANGLLDGLLRLNGAAHIIGTDGWITVDDILTGDITPKLKATVTKDLQPGSYVYDVQRINAAGVKTWSSGVLLIPPDVARLVA